ncbi:hypothetical protein ACLOJK_003933 [Asimina triloba]
MPSRLNLVPHFHLDAGRVASDSLSPSNNLRAKAHTCGFFKPWAPSVHYPSTNGHDFTGRATQVGGPRLLTHPRCHFPRALDED